MVFLVNIVKALGAFYIFFGQLDIASMFFSVLIAALLQKNIIYQSRFSSFKILPTVKYFCFILKEIASSSLKLCWVLIKKEELKPVIKLIEVNLHHVRANFVLANAITLTPGTLTVEFTENTLKIHSLSKVFATGVESTQPIQKYLYDCF